MTFKVPTAVLWEGKFKYKSKRPFYLFMLMNVSLQIDHTHLDMNCQANTFVE